MKGFIKWLGLNAATNCLLPVFDFWKTRRRPLLILAIPLLASAIFSWSNLLIAPEWLSNFLSTQINIIAILISFSIASVAIIVSSNSDIVATLRETKTVDTKRYRNLRGEVLSLFQILLSNITYNIAIEVAYLAFLIIQSLCQFESKFSIKILMGFDIFFISHILCVLMTTVYQLYLIFWNDIAKKDSCDKK